MLTIKMVEPNGKIFVRKVCHFAFFEKCDTPDGTPAITFWLPENGGMVNVFSGDVYVMNENGKTVADFHLN